MTNLPTDESIRAAFARLRSDELWVTPPGPDLARRTVRRRRRVAAATASAGITAVVVLGAGYLAGLGTGEPDPGQALDPAIAGPTDEPAATASPGDPVLDPELRRLAERATEALDTPERDVFRAVIAPGPAPSSVAGPAERDPGAETDPRPAERQPPGRFVMEDREPGEYLLQVTCAGSGSVAVTVRAGDNEATATAQCATALAQVIAGSGEAVLSVGAGRAIDLMTEPERLVRPERAVVMTLTRTEP